MHTVDGITTHYIRSGRRVIVAVFGVHIILQEKGEKKLEYIRGRCEVEMEAIASSKCYA